MGLLWAIPYCSLDDLGSANRNEKHRLFRLLAHTILRYAFVIRKIKVESTVKRGSEILESILSNSEEAARCRPLARRFLPILKLQRARFCFISQHEEAHDGTAATSFRPYRILVACRDWKQPIILSKEVLRCCCRDGSMWSMCLLITDFHVSESKD